MANGDWRVPKLHAKAWIRLFLNVKRNGCLLASPSRPSASSGFSDSAKETADVHDIIKRSAGNGREPCEKPRSPFPVPF